MVECLGYRSPGDSEAECSGRAAQKLNGDSVNGFKVETKLLPLSYDAVDQFIDSIPDNHDYEVSIIQSVCCHLFTSLLIDSYIMSSHVSCFPCNSTSYGTVHRLYK